LKSTLRILLLGLIFCAIDHGGNIYAESIDFEVEKKFAARFCVLQAHVEFARMCRDEGHALTAFFILERAKKLFFDPKRFLIVFDHHFHQKPLEDFTEHSVHSLLAQPDNAHNAILKWESALQYYLLQENFEEARKSLHRLREGNPEVYRYALQSDQVETQLCGQVSWQFREQFFERNPHAFETQFYGNQNTEWEMEESQKAETLLQKFQDRPELKAWLAGIYAKQGRIVEAASLFEEITKNGSLYASLRIQAASFYEHLKHDVDLALKNYLLAYFEDPESEMPKSLAQKSLAQKITDLARQQAGALFEIVQKTKPMEYVLASTNPKLQILLLEELADQDPKSHKNIFLKMLQNRDAATREQACAILTEEGLLSAIEVEALAQSEHPFERGLSLYIATGTQHPKVSVYLKEALHSDVDLLRFDAISALIPFIHAGSPSEKKSFTPAQAKALLQEQEKSEKNPWLREYIQSSALFS
jgi:hypothetical protein